MRTFQFLPSVHDTDTVTCRRCKTRQYPKTGRCIRCHHPLGVDYLCFQIGDQLGPNPEDHPKQLECSIGDLLRILRKRRGICQSQLAKMATGIDRSYLSKAECGLVLLPLSKLLPLAQALGLTAVILRFEATGSRKFQNQAAVVNAAALSKFVLSKNNPK